MTGHTDSAAITKSMLNAPVREQDLRKSQDPKAGAGQDDSLPVIPSMSIGVAQHDMELEKQRMMHLGLPGQDS